MSPTAPTTPGTPTTPATPVTWVRRHRAGLVVGLGLLAGVLVALLATSGTRTATPVDPDNPDPGGAQALARVLADQGVEVVVARDADALEATEVGPGDTVLVTTPEKLGESTADRLLAHLRGARLVVAGGGPGTTQALGVGVEPSRVTVGGGRAAACTDPALAPVLDGLRLEVDSALAYPVAGCFAGGSGTLVAAPSPDVVLLGAEQALTNDQVLRADNAAVALRLLGADDRLVWYVPSVEDLLADDGTSVETLLPPWLRPGLLLLGVVAVAVVAWRGRRLGALASEPLPVTVRAIETTRSRGRLYRRAGDRGHAAAALRRAARERAGERLGLGAHAPTEAVVRAVAARTARSPDEVGALLGEAAPAPATDKDLTTLGHDLAELDREVRRP